MRRLRTGSIGSMSAWLPSRRSTAHQMGAAARCAGSATCGRGARRSGTNGWYFSKGICSGVTGSGGIAALLAAVGSGPENERTSWPLGRRRFGECRRGTRLHEEEEAEGSRSSPTRVPVRAALVNAGGPTDGSQAGRASLEGGDVVGVG